MKRVDAPSAWPSLSDLDKQESGGRDPPQGVAPHAPRGVVGAVQRTWIINVGNLSIQTVMERSPDSNDSTIKPLYNETLHNITNQLSYLEFM